MLNMQRCLDVLHLAMCTWEDIEEAGCTAEDATIDAFKFKKGKLRVSFESETSWRISLLDYVAGYTKATKQSFERYVLDTEHKSSICNGYYTLDTDTERKDMCHVLAVHRLYK